MVETIRGRITTTAVTIAATATAIPTTALPGRISILIQNNGANTMYLGNASVTVDNGYPLASGDSLSLDLGVDVLFYGIVAADTEELRIMEGA